MLQQLIPLTILTNSISIFDVLTKANVNTEKWLMVDLQTVKCSYRDKYINKVAFILS